MLFDSLGSCQAGHRDDIDHPGTAGTMPATIRRRKVAAARKAQPSTESQEPRSMSAWEKSLVLQEARCLPNRMFLPLNRNIGRQKKNHCRYGELVDRFSLSWSTRIPPLLPNKNCLKASNPPPVIAGLRPGNPAQGRTVPTKSGWPGRSPAMTC